MPKDKVQGKPSVTMRTMHFYWDVTKESAGMFALAVLSTLGFVLLLSYANPYIVSLIVDRVAQDAPQKGEVLATFGPYIAAFVVVNVVGQACSKLQDFAVWKLEIATSYSLYTKSFDTLCNQSMTFHSNRFGGSLVSQTTKFMNAYSMLIENLIYAVIPIAASVVFTVVLLLPYIPIYSLVVFVLACIYVVVVYKMFKSTLPLNEKTAAAQNKLSGELSDSVTNILSVKTSGREAFERRIFDEANTKVRAADSKRMLASTLRGAVAAGIIVVIMVMVALFAAGGSTYFGVSAGTLVMMFTYTYSMSMQLNRINLLFQQLNRAIGDAHDMTVILDEPMLVSDDEGAPELVVDEGEIKFSHIGFSYAEAEGINPEGGRLRVFDDFTCVIPAGQHVGLVGRSGSGKTTLTTLLLRLANIQEGQVLIDGQDIARVTQTSLRQKIAYVPQEPLLFHRSIFDNIAYGKPNASFAEVSQAAEKANATEFIERLPEGFDTFVGERGVKLSGGQRQRIAIARAILTDAPILVLDEATSALDSESEKLIQDALANLMRGRTSIVVAHRLSTVASLDRIIVLSDGKIVEDGTHSQLVDAGGEYARLWNRQSGSFLGS